MATTLLHNIGQKKRPLNRSLTIEYWKNRANRFLLGFLENMLDKLAEKVIFQLDDTASTLMEAYEEADNISVQEAEEAYPDIKEIRKLITKQKKKFAEVDYADSKEVERKFHKLVRLANRLEARVQKKMYQEEQPEPAPDYIKDKMRENSRKMVENAAI